MSPKSRTFFILFFFFLIVLIGLIVYCFLHPELLNLKGKYQNKIGQNFSNKAIKEEKSILSNSISTITQNETTTLPSSDLFGSYYSKAEELLKTMSLEDQVGQMFFVRCPESNQIDMIQNLKPAGFILFGRDFKNKTKEQVMDDISSYQKASNIPLLMGTDEEGGSVVRVSSNRNLCLEDFNSPSYLYQIGGFEKIISDTKEKSKLLLSLGINVNLAPVADVSTNPNDFIYKRTFQKDALQTSEYVEKVVKTMLEEGISCTLKHFPGYGNNIDTHTDVAHDHRSYDTFTSSDFKPFEAGIQAGATSILVSHNIVSCMDETHPASLSPKVHEILRNDLGFTGVIITDDLAMDAITKYTKGTNAAVEAVKAGNDLIITTDFASQKQAILDAVQNDEISKDDIYTHVLRVLAWKYSMGILE